MKATIRITHGGTIACLYTEIIPLQELGSLEVIRATDICFCDKTQQWDVHCVSTGKLLYSDLSRDRCLAWERDNLAPPNPNVTRPANTLTNINLATLSIP